MQSIDVIICGDCNFSCDYCFEKSKLTKEVITKETIDRIYEYCNTTFKEENPNEKLLLNLIGGEPFLHGDMLTYALQKLTGVQDATFCIVSNGYLAGNFINTIKEISTDKIYLFISYDFCFQANRMAGSNEKIEENIKLYLQNGYRVTTHSVLKPTNFENFNEFIDNIIAFRNSLTEEERNLLNHTFTVQRIPEEACDYNKVKSVLLNVRSLYNLSENHIYHGVIRIEDRNKQIPYDKFDNEIFCGIAPNGDMFPCYSCYFDDTSRSTRYANIFDDFSTIRKNKIKKRIEVERVRDHQCDDCSFNCSTNSWVAVETDLNQWGKKQNEKKCKVNELLTKYL